MSVRLRLAGLRTDVDRVLGALADAGIDVETDGLIFGNPDEPGIRVYATAHTATTRPAEACPCPPVTVSADHEPPTPGRGGRALPPGGDR